MYREGKGVIPSLPGQLKNATLVSIVVPIYNTEKYLGKCLDSILSQSYRNIEIICINDGSSDDSDAILLKYARMDSRIVVIERTEASGSGALPRNIGIKQSKGEFIAFVDADDYLDTYYIERLLWAAKTNEADLVLCSNYRVDENGSVIEEDTELHYEYIDKNKRVFSGFDISDRLFQISNAAVWHRLFKKTLIINNKLLFQENVPILDDVFFVNATLVAANRICIICDRLIYYRDRRRGSQTSQIERHYESIFNAFFRLIEWMKDHNYYDLFKYSLNNWILAMMIWWYSNIQDKSISSKVFLLYKNDYFKKLSLDTMPLNQISPLYEGFFVDVIHNQYHPPLGVILNSMTNKRVALYGAGRLGRRIMREVEDYNISVALWCDSNYKAMKEMGISSPEALKTVKADYVLIAVRNQKAIKEIKECLMKQLNIPETIIYSV